MNITEAIKEIDDFCIEEYDTHAVVDDLENIDVAHITYICENLFPDEKFELQVKLNLKNPSIIRTLDEVTLPIECFDSLDSLISHISFLHLISLSESDWEYFGRMRGEVNKTVGE